MNRQTQTEIATTLQEHGRIMARVRKAVVTDDSPLTVELGGDEVPASIVHGAAAGIGDIVDVLVAGNRPPLILAGGGASALSAYNNFSDKANGAPGAADSGQTPLLTNGAASSPANAALRVASGYLTYAATNNGYAAGYYEIPLDGEVRYIEGVFKLGTHSAPAGSATFALWAEPLHGTYPTIPDSPFHLSLVNDGWTLSVFEDNADDQLASGGYTLAGLSSLVNDTDYLFQGVRTGDTALLFIDGQLFAKVTDPRIESISGVVACWECYAYDADSDARSYFRRIAADSDDPLSRAPSRAASAAQALAVAEGAVDDFTLHGPFPRGVSHSPETLLSAAVPVYGSGSTPIDADHLAVSVVAPPSGKILFSLQGFVAMSGDCLVLWSVKNVDGADYATHTVLDAQRTGPVTSMHMVEGLTPGEEFTFTWNHFATAGSTATFKAGGATSYGASMLAVPVT